MQDTQLVKDQIDIIPLKQKLVIPPPASDAFQSVAKLAELSNDLGTIKRGNLGRNILSLVAGDSLDKALRDLQDTGGIIYLAAGTYTITSALTGYSSIQIIGENKATTIIDFASTAAKLSFAGTSSYATGTITSIASGVNVTGSGTSWLANVTTNHQFFIAGKWYKIAAVTGDTTLVLSEGYAGGATFPGSAYRTAILKTDIEIKEVTIKNSTGNALDFDDCRDVSLEDVELISNNVGLTADYCSEFTGDRIIIASSTGNGATFTQCGFLNLRSFSTPSNGAHGTLLNTCRIVTFDSSSSSSNTSDGYNITSCSNVLLGVQASSNGGQGIELVSGNVGILVQNGLVESNTSDGIKLTATSDDCIISNSLINSNGGYGVNVAAATDDNNIISFNKFASNSSGNVNNGGTGTITKGNIGVSDFPAVALIAGSGSLVKVINETTNIVIAHGLGGTPKLIKITCIAGPGTNQTSISVGSGTSATNRSCVTLETTTGSGNQSFQNAAAIIELRDNSDVVRFLCDINALDATNITLSVTTNDNVGSNRLIIWEAFA